MSAITAGKLGNVRTYRPYAPGIETSCQFLGRNRRVLLLPDLPKRSRSNGVRFMYLLYNV